MKRIGREANYKYPNFSVGRWLEHLDPSQNMLVAPKKDFAGLLSTYIGDNIESAHPRFSLRACQAIVASIKVLFRKNNKSLRSVYGQYVHTGLKRPRSEGSSDIVDTIWRGTTSTGCSRSKASSVGSKETGSS
jgi:hypothetical protein